MTPRRSLHAEAPSPDEADGAGPLDAEHLADIALHIGLADDLRDGASRIVKHAIDLTTADWAEVVEVSPTGGFQILAAIDADLSAALYRSRDLSPHSPPLPSRRSAHDRIVIRDMSQDDRWPGLAIAAQTLPVRSAVLEQLVVDGRYSAALAVYDHRPHYFSDTHLDRIQFLARVATPVIAGLAAADDNSHLRIALTSNREISAAVGMVMNAYEVDQDRAFALLVETSQHHNRKLRDIAKEILTTRSLAL